MKTNWVTILTCNTWSDLTPIKKVPTGPQKNLRILGAVDECSDPP
jgi:hypothetical protein